MGRIPSNFDKVIAQLAQKLAGRNYAIRGTASLVLQGLDMNVDDIDIVCDRETALACNQIFSDFIVSTISLQESAQYKSYFGKFVIEGTEVEVMGEWQIKTKTGWSKPFIGEPFSLVSVAGGEVKVTTIASELDMFAAMGRWTALKKIKSQLPADEQQSLLL